MRFRDLAFSSLRRRRGRTLFLILSLTVGVALIITVISVTAAMQAGVDSKLPEFGANRVVMPRSVEMPIPFGRISLGAVPASAGELPGV